MAIDDLDVLGLVPLFPEETEEAIAERYEQWANEGLTPDDSEEWIDTRAPSFWFIATRPCIRQDAKTYDLMGTEFVAAAMPLLSWGEYLDDLAAGVKIERNAATFAKGIVTFTGEPGTEIAPGTTVAVEGPADQVEAQEYEVTEAGIIPEGPEPEAPGSIDLPVVALESGAAASAPAAAVTLLQSEVAGVEAVTNADPILGGADPESDESLRERLIESKDGEGPGNTTDYKVWSRAYSGEIGRVVVIPLWNGAGTVLVIVLTASGDPVSEETVDGLQLFLDPVPGKGEGLAPVGATVTVATAEGVPVDADLEVEFEVGYSLDGAGGSIALEDALKAAIALPISGSQPGGEVVLQSVAAAVMSIRGVHDLRNLKLNGKAENVALEAVPAQVGEPGAITITPGSF
jgi:uncharacterized phage protein gp47/JayE